MYHKQNTICMRTYILHIKVTIKQCINMCTNVSPNIYEICTLVNMHL